MGVVVPLPPIPGLMGVAVLHVSTATSPSFLPVPLGSPPLVTQAKDFTISKDGTPKGTLTEGM